MSLFERFVAGDDRTATPFWINASIDRFTYRPPIIIRPNRWDRHSKKNTNNRPPEAIPYGKQITLKAFSNFSLPADHRIFITDFMRHY